VDRPADSRPRLTAAIIVKNEAEHLAGCLASIEPIVDEIVVVDTGSTDSSAEVAKSFGAEVLHHDWDGNFSEARNLGLDRASGEWILYIDADERIEAPTDKTALDAVLDRADASRVGALRLHFTLLEGCSHAYEWRMWRHDPAVRFEGIIHESITPSLAAKLNAAGASYADTDDIRLVHLGYEGDQMRKHERNLPLLLAEAERNPTRPYLFNHLGRIYEALGQPEEARAMWDRGIEVVRQTEPSRRFLVDSLSYADVLVRAGEAGQDESALLAEGLELFPTNWLIRWAAALDALNKGDFDGAAVRAQEVLDAQPDEIHRSGVTYPTRLFADWPHHLIGMCRFEQGRFEEAAAEFEQAQRMAPETTEYAVKARLAKARANSTVSP
jgi:glycosyltransferase involved in cell wall biosynthesis